jgi:hypothetical protein
MLLLIFIFYKIEAEDVILPTLLIVRPDIVVFLLDRVELIAVLASSKQVNRGVGYLNHILFHFVGRGLFEALDHRAVLILVVGLHRVVSKLFHIEILVVYEDV